MSSTLTSMQASAAPDAPYREAWRAFESNPGALVFLLGCQRSGTTWLHLQLARTAAFRYLSAYDVHACDALVHNHRQGLAEMARGAFEASLRGAAADRGIDAIPASAATPEEYGLALGTATLRYEQADTTIATLPHLRELCAKKALIEGRSQPLLLKSPPDYPAAIPLLAQAWPDVRFIAIQRHPLRTLQSQVRAWRELVLRCNPYLRLIDRGYRALFDDAGRRMQLGIFLHSPAGIEWLADCILQAHLAFVAMLDGAGGTQPYLLRYEDLCMDQAAAFAGLSRALNMALPAPAQAPLPREMPIAADVRQAYEARQAAFSPYLERFGYNGEPL